MSDRVKNIKNAEPRERFKTEEERLRHKWLISRRRHARIVNENFNTHSLYSTLTMDNEHEVHTFEEARRVRDLYVRRLKYANPDAQIIIYMGRGKSTNRIHFHMLSNGLDEKTIAEKWQAGSVMRIEHLRAHNYYDGVDHGQDYTGLADYLFDHWTPEQGDGSHRYKATKNIRQPDREEPTIAKRNYSESKPPRAPKGYTLVECKGNRFGFKTGSRRNKGNPRYAESWRRGAGKSPASGNPKHVQERQDNGRSCKFNQANFRKEEG